MTTLLHFSDLLPCTFTFSCFLQHNIVAPYDGVVEEVFVQKGGMVNQNEEIVKIAAKE